jgi:hypothetical protein
MSHIVVYGCISGNLQFRKIVFPLKLNNAMKDCALIWKILVSILAVILILGAILLAMLYDDK